MALVEGRQRSCCLLLLEDWWWPAGFWPEQLGEVIFGPPKISYGFRVAKTPLRCLQPFPKRLGCGLILGEDALQCPACKTAGGASREQGAGGEAALGKSWLKNPQILLLSCPVGGGSGRMRGTGAGLCFTCPGHRWPGWDVAVLGRAGTHPRHGRVLPGSAFPGGCAFADPWLKIAGPGAFFLFCSI